MAGIPITSASSSGDTCPDQFWAEVRNLTSEPPGTVMTVSVEFDRPSASCGGTEVALGLYDRDSNGTHSQLDTAQGGSSYSSGCAGSCATGCFSPQASVSSAALDAGDVVRIWTVLDPEVEDGDAALRVAVPGGCVIDPPGDG